MITAIKPLTPINHGPDLALDYSSKISSLSQWTPNNAESPPVEALVLHLGVLRFPPPITICYQEIFVDTKVPSKEFNEIKRKSLLLRKHV